MEFNIRKGNVELRSCGKHLLQSEKPHYRAEIVVWEKGAGKYCYTVAYFEPDKEGFNLKTVLDRPVQLEEDNFQGFIQMMKVGFSLLYMFWNEE